jgi:D-xylose transport system permease protein
MSTSTTAAQDTDAAIASQGTIGHAVRAYAARVRGGNIGSLPAVLGIVALIILFTALKPGVFNTAFNAANLINQSAAVIFIAMGLIFVLLLGEIDLSAGFAAGTSAAIMAVLLTQRGAPWPVAIVGCLITGAVIGSVIGFLVARLGIPSFVVTLAGFLGLQGVMLLVIGEGGTIAVRDDTILAIMNKNLPPVFGWAFFVVVVGGFAALGLLEMRRRRAAGLPVQSPAVFGAKVVGLAVVIGAIVLLLNAERSKNTLVSSLRGIPMIVPIALVFLIGLTFLLTRTAFGRHVYAVGGNAEAARRAGISVPGVRIACFVICSTMAAIGGILFASRDNSVSPSTGGSTTLLLAVGAAVIGGTSLFGGRGRVIDAILGGLVVAIIQNGLPLITSKSAAQFIVIALVLLLAASVDAISRRQSAATGR